MDSWLSSRLSEMDGSLPSGETAIVSSLADIIDQISDASELFLANFSKFFDYFNVDYATVAFDAVDQKVAAYLQKFRPFF